MATPIANAMVDHSVKDGTGDAINGSEVDENTTTISRVLDGTTATRLNQATNNPLSIENPILMDVSVAAGGVRTAGRLRHDPASGTVTAGDGPAWLFEADDSAGNVTSIGRLSVQWVTPTDGATEAAELITEIRRAGALIEALALSGTETTLNESGADIDLRIESDTNANAVMLDSGLFTGVGAIGLGAAAANTSCVLIDPPALTAAANTNIARLRLGNTAAITVPAGTTSIAAALSIEEPNFTATGTITSAVTLYIVGAPTEGGTNNHAVWVAGGTSRFAGNTTFDAAIICDSTTDTTSTTTGSIQTDGGIGIAKALWVGTTSRLVGAVTMDGTAYIGDTSNASVTLGLTINQGANDDEILSLKSSDVAHGMTDRTETDTYAYFKKLSALNGGLLIEGLADTGSQGIQIIGVGITDNTAKTTAAAAYIELYAAIKSGLSVGNPGIDANLVAIRLPTGSTTRFIFDTEGSAHADVEWVAFDNYDDMALVSEMESVLVEKETSEQTKRRRFLEETGIIGGNSWHVENGKFRAMVNFTRLAMLHHGALIQAGERIKAYESKILDLEKMIVKRLR